MPSEIIIASSRKLRHPRRAGRVSRLAPGPKRADQAHPPKKVADQANWGIPTLPHPALSFPIGAEACLPTWGACASPANAGGAPNAGASLTSPAEPAAAAAAAPARRVLIAID